jgi:hypothetical protein
MLNAPIHPMTEKPSYFHGAEDPFSPAFFVLKLSNHPKMPKPEKTVQLFSCELDTYSFWADFMKGVQLQTFRFNISPTSISCSHSGGGLLVHKVILYFCTGFL